MTNRQRAELLFPDYKDLWNMLVDFSTPGVQFPHERWKYFAKSCFRDMADLLQTSRNYLRKSTEAYEADYAHLKDSSRTAARTLYFREAFDYGAISLITVAYSFTAALWHIILRVNEAENHYYTPGQLIGRLSKYPAPNCIKSELISEVQIFYANPSFVFMQKYRNYWVHQGYPLLKGEVRRTRRDPYINREFIDGVFGHFGNGWPIIASETYQYSPFSLLRNASKCYKLILSTIIEFLYQRDPEKVKQYDLQGLAAFA